ELCALVSGLLRPISISYTVLISFMCSCTIRFSPSLFFSPAPAPTEISTLSLHDALPICTAALTGAILGCSFSTVRVSTPHRAERSEEHTSELQSRFDLVCRLLLEKKKENTKTNT